MNKNKQKILFIKTDPATVDPRIQKEVSSLSQMGFDIRVLGWDRRWEFPPKQDIRGVEYLRARIPAPYASKLLLFFLPIFWIRVCWEILRFHPNVIHACDLDAFIPTLVIKKLQGYSIVYDVFDHFAEKMTGIPNWFRIVISEFDNFLMRYADTVIVTDETRLALVANAQVKNACVIMNVPPKIIVSTLKTDIVKKFRICQVGAIHQHRGLNLIAEAVKGIDDIETVFAGWIPRKIDEEYLKNQKSIIFLGKLEYAKALELVASSDIILALYDPSLPINALASSNKIFEAMSVSRPVITNIGTSMEKIVRDENCGCLIPYGNVDALRQAILQLKSNRNLSKQLGSNGYQAFKNKYNWDIMELRIQKIYSELLSN